MEEHVFGGAAKSSKLPARPIFEAMKRGFLGRCPHCGKGKLFRAFLKVNDHCAACGEEYHHHRADDLPAYLVIVIVGHIAVGGVLSFERMTNWSSWTHLAIWIPITILMAIALINPIKGSVVGLQWALRMHGFGDRHEEFEKAYGDQ
ncbi:hypothetical protein GCM10011385_04900 [Nitratireductor aestuarii]|uniref:DUF983 domain-containing protein n=1 Tax=Nitratireductor aestuarii TaxID=1735103 RepID=A0A916RF92_9HYPH|nr:DUF983 domain-containing protein [Nitratireductor aestuarii]GGA54340.1 hypothetical protein GCM10011385_04900 [Nitratireductor aestuarii]